VYKSFCYLLKERKPRAHNNPHAITPSLFGWLMSHAGLSREKSTAGWLLVADLL
jgi:hypothetical protein